MICPYCGVVGRDELVKIYCLSDPRPGRKELYVGASVDPQNRLKGHISEARGYKHSRKDLWILDLLTAGLLPELTVYFSVPQTEGQQAEQDVISAVRATRGKKLLNVGSSTYSPARWKRKQ